MSPERNPSTIRLALPKGRMFDQIVDLLKGAGIQLRNSERGYRPTISLPDYSTKILKPRNVIGMLMAGARDLGFAGADWIVETGCQLNELMDTGLNPVRLVVAAPTKLLRDGQLPDRPLVVATEYPNIAQRWIAERKLDASVLQTFGATEVFPPEDADCIIDNTATGSTLRANGLEIIDEVMTSSTRLYASEEAMNDPSKKERIDNLVMLLNSVLEARTRVMLELNVEQENLASVLEMLPAMRSPTVSQLRDSDWVAVRSAIPRKELATMVPKLKLVGARDIVVTNAEQLIP